ncbi:Aste57867_14945 [Aphanomyces stellatus]|uniref:Aste57867_14945 protein n=1 Tax=Aphanomyces stellatus TaxID=120398 RepID=A0A485L3R7_9STRA|nr:hypothetical protein As57867_014889 [Aphanomyces stellatus]VFT91759.1 Aste57867_14945 [Aphanomyces stellatus]
MSFSSSSSSYGSIQAAADLVEPTPISSPISTHPPSPCCRWLARPLSARAFGLLFFHFLHVLLGLLAPLATLASCLASIVAPQSHPILRTANAVAIVDINWHNAMVDVLDDATVVPSTYCRRIFVHFDLGAGAATSAIEGHRMRPVSRRTVLFFAVAKLPLALFCSVLPLLAYVAALLLLLLGWPHAEMQARVIGLVGIYGAIGLLDAAGDFATGVTRHVCSESFVSFEYLHAVAGSR